METLFTSSRPDSDFEIIKIGDSVYAIDEDRTVGGWGAYRVEKESIFLAGSNERIRVYPDGEVERIDRSELDTDHYDVFFGDFNFPDGCADRDELIDRIAEEND